MTDPRVEQLVEKVVEQLWMKFWGGSLAVWKWEEVRTGNDGKEYYDIAKQILFGNNLVLIDRDTYWLIKSILVGVDLRQEADEAITWKTELMTLVNEWGERVIPLEEAE